MIIKTLFSLFIFCVSLNTFGQDTIKVGKSRHYTDKEVRKLTGKGFGGKYGQENIIFSKEHIKVEFCYYNEKTRK